MARRRYRPEGKYIRTSTLACRVPIFAATRRPRRTTYSVATAWGSARITGRLGQAHRDVLDALAACCNGYRETGGDTYRYG